MPKCWLKFEYDFFVKMNFMAIHAFVKFFVRHIHTR